MGRINCYAKQFVIVRNYSTKWNQPNGIDTGVKIYNCIVKSKVPLIITNPNFMTWYTCGPTVYDSAHIGHASSYVKIDILQRILKDYFKINLITAVNITDIDDKIIKRSLELKEDWKIISKKYETEFHNDLSKLRVISPSITIRVSDNIKEIIQFIDKLMKQDFAYATTDGSVYFKIEKYPAYGKLQRLNLEMEEDNDKISKVDFALWKGAKDNEPFWETPWGNGRPGWHIECSAMASKLFGSNIDFHAGGLDLRFPHHENEDAQSCTFHNCNQWINYWIHTGQLHIKGQQEKMSKSLKNTISVTEVLKKYSVNEFRMLCLLSHYRNSMEFSPDVMDTAVSTLRRIYAFNSDSLAYLKGLKVRCSFDSKEVFDKINLARASIDAALKDDFNTSKTIAIILELASTMQKLINHKQKETENYESFDYVPIVSAMHFIENTLNILGINTSNEIVKTEDIDVSDVINNIIKIRGDIRENAVIKKDKELFQICDQIRINLKDCGIEIKDHGKLSSWNYINKN